MKRKVLLFVAFTAMVLFGTQSVTSADEIGLNASPLDTFSAEISPEAPFNSVVPLALREAVVRNTGYISFSGNVVVHSYRSIWYSEYVRTVGTQTNRTDNTGYYVTWLYDWR